MENNQEYHYITRRIGSTSYKVKVAFSNEAESMEEKILRMIRNETMEIGEKSGIPVIRS